MVRTNINENWLFLQLPDVSLDTFSQFDSIDWSKSAEVSIPHTWYDDEKQYQGVAAYRRTIKEKLTSQKWIIECEGIERQCRIYINRILVGEHKGSYARFRICVPQSIQNAQDWDVIILVDNRGGDTISPLTGDFTIFGGIYRDINILSVNEIHFDYTYYGTDGVIVRTTLDDNQNGVVSIEPHVVIDKTGIGNICICYEILSEENNIVAAMVGTYDEKVTVRIDKPKLWNGKGQTSMYRVRANLVVDTKVLDQVTVTIGFRSVVFDSEKGLFLNGKNIKLCGVAKHQDFAGVYNAVGKAHIDKDFQLIGEIGANAVRLSHYQHPQYTYNLCDEQGYLVWAEIPMLKMTLNEELFENVKEQLRELILQNINHPSIICWGIQNEIAMFRDDSFMHEKCSKLSELVHELDPDRYSAGANLYSVKAKSKMNEISDIVGYNIYFGWYYGEMNDYSDYLDKLHDTKPNVPYGISEYGVDASIALHSDNPHIKDYSEEYQALFHETVYPIIEKKEYLWGSFVWNMFDFHSSRRNEGGERHINAKGLVTYDRGCRKDAFYYYKAKWSSEPVLHLCSKRFANRHTQTINIKVYTNLQEVQLVLNGKSIAYEKNNGNATILFKNVKLCEGTNHVIAKAGYLEDEVDFIKVSEPDESYTLPESNAGGTVRNWFLEDDMVREGYYSISNRADEILASKEARNVLERYVPELVKEMTLKDEIPLGLALKSILQRSLPDENKSEILKAINGELNQIRDEEL